MKTTYYSHGKLLLTGEYVVLDGATALALPTKLGQTLTVEIKEAPGIHWKSLDADGSCWFDSEIQLKGDCPVEPISKRLYELLHEAKKLNPQFLSGESGYDVTAQLEFARDWGLGSSSTLVNNIAEWAQIDPYALLKNTFGGSGYDIAVASEGSPILYRRVDGEPVVKTARPNWDFKDKLFFVHLNKKQDSRDGISLYRTTEHDKNEAISSVSHISLDMLKAESIDEFRNCMDTHEEIISKLLGIPTVKLERFPEYSGSIKSLGAWGGDFILATGSEAHWDYFRSKGYQTILPYSDMIK